MSYDLNQPHNFTSINEELKWNQKENLDPFNTAIVEYYRKWHKQGKESKHKGFERINPYYGRNSAIKEYFFYCGYDGAKFEDALSTMQDKMKEIEQSSEPAGNGTQSTNGLTT